MGITVRHPHTSYSELAMTSCTKAAAAEELREAGQRKITAYAERAAAAERQAREATLRFRGLESAHTALQVGRSCH